MSAMQHNSFPLKINPYPYQEDGIRFGVERKRVFIADQPGLGKTLQAIGIVCRARAFPCLVICPSSLKVNWQREFQKFSQAKAVVLSDATKSWPFLIGSKPDSFYQVAVTNFESLRKFFVLDTPKPPFTLSRVRFSPAARLFRSVIIDECHRVKDRSAQQTIFTKGITLGKPYVIMLSGTPVVNSPSDLVAQLSIMNRLNDFGGLKQFESRYMGKSPNLDELSERLFSTCFIRRKKADVLKDLPEKSRFEVAVQLSDREPYTKAETELADYLRTYRECSEAKVRALMKREALTRFMELRKLSSLYKTEAAAEFIQTLLDAGEKVIVFVSFHRLVDELKQRFTTAVCVTGRDSASAKQQAVDSFQSDPDTRVIICSIKAAGVGLTLTAASNVVFVELPWTSADSDQCEDRAHRIGQKTNVSVYYLLAEDTIDTRLYNIIQNKKIMAQTVMGDTDEIPVSDVYLDELINSILSPNKNNLS